MGHATKREFNVTVEASTVGRNEGWYLRDRNEDVEIALQHDQRVMQQTDVANEVLAGYVKYI